MKFIKDLLVSIGCILWIVFEIVVIIAMTGIGVLAFLTLLWMLFLNPQSMIMDMSLAVRVGIFIFLMTMWIIGYILWFADLRTAGGFKANERKHIS